MQYNNDEYINVSTYYYVDRNQSIGGDMFDVQYYEFIMQLRS